MAQPPLEKITIRVRGLPKPQPRPRVFTDGEARTPEMGRPKSGAYAVSIVDPKVKLWAAAVGDAAKRAAERLGQERVDSFVAQPLCLDAWFFLAADNDGKNAWQWHTKAPDIDNLLKLALDKIFVPPRSFGRGLCLYGDERVCHLRDIRKVIVPRRYCGAIFTLSPAAPISDEELHHLKTLLGA